MIFLIYVHNFKTIYIKNGESMLLFTFGSSEGVLGKHYPNKWLSEDLLPLWRPTMERYYKSVVDVGKKLLGLVALALDLEENFFERLGAFNDQAAVVRLLRYSGELNSSKEEEPCGASAHSDFGMLTLLATDGVPGLQVCRDKDKEPNVWEDVPGIKGVLLSTSETLWRDGLMGFSGTHQKFNLFISGHYIDFKTSVLCAFYRSTMHRVLSVGEERYSVAVFLDPDPNCVVECLESCCSQTYPPSFHRSEPVIISTSDSANPSS
ncbi:PREDICTED: uncharacterized protein LOC106308752 isoform X2 [Brassica oleracea var. oleracea]|uniref:uncharacterized protein LOC106308752 isoform X2 n=1 Tax=Brassica oleracea var. oleracea TaxID=109376 RepID=UPI0006A75656|nr:PREDICTED: uncharacterized protein LOC106308752 isoform X2 [Brassica oleracea var. oleracea]